MTNEDNDRPPQRPMTRLVHTGRGQDGHRAVRQSAGGARLDGAVPDDRGHARHRTGGGPGRPQQRYTYGRRGTPTSDALEAAMNDLEGADGTVVVPSGLAAAAIALLSCLSAGDRLFARRQRVRARAHLCQHGAEAVRH